MKYYCINNEITTSTNISFQDRGFRFGDGVFETISVFNHKPYLLHYHIERLKAGLEALSIITNVNIITSNLLKLITINNHKEGIVRIIVSRGVGSTGYLPHDNITPTTIIETDNSSPIHDDFIHLNIAKYEKLSPRAVPTQAKLLQNVNSILTKIEARNNGYFDSVMLNHKAEICEVSSGNIFWVKNNKIYTPSLECGLVAGIIRRRIIEKFPVNTGKFYAQDLLDAEEVFITNISWLVLIVHKIAEVDLNKRKLSLEIQSAIIKDKALHCS